MIREISMNDGVIIIGAAFLADLILGDPSYSMHPVRLIGNWAIFVEKNFLKFNFTGIIAGIFFWFSTVIPIVLICLLIYSGINFAIFFIPDLCSLAAEPRCLNSFPHLTPSIVWQTFIVYSCFAFRDMVDHVKPIHEGLKKKDIKFARKKLGRIVGRDVDRLKEDGIIRAAVESISESFVDGFLSPLFWFAAGYAAAGFFSANFAGISGTAAMLIYRVSNTLDSMVGYQNDKYEKFGKFSARVDDAMNFIPARLSLFFLVPGIIFARSNVISAIRMFFRDRLKSKSPNAAHSMSIFAGALEITLGGRAYYEGEALNKPILGDSREINKEIKSEMLAKAVKIFTYSGIITILLLMFFLFKPV